MTTVTKSPIDGVLITPTLYKENASDGGRTHAAFLMTMRIPFGNDQSPEITRINFNLAAVIAAQFDALVAANSWPKDTDGKRHLAALGIPATYASSFKELKAFLGVDRFAIYNPRMLGAMVVFGNKDGHPTGPNSLTLRHGPIAFERVLQGNYREMVAKYRFFSKADLTACTPDDLIQCVVNTERTDFVLTVGRARKLAEDFGVEMTRGQVEFEFTLIDRRTNMPAQEVEGYGG